MCSHLLLPQKKHLKSFLMKKHSERKNAEFIIIIYYSYNDNTQTFLSTEQKEKIKPLAQRDFEINGNKVWICLCV